MWVLHKTQMWVLSQIAWLVIDYRLAFFVCAPSAGGRLHGLHAHPERTWSGEGHQKEGGALRSGVQGGGRGAAHFVIALWPLTPPARALSALTWETWWPQRKAIFLFPGNHVCNNTNRVPTVRPTTWYFVFHGFTDDTDKTRWFPLSFSFLPGHCDCISEKLHPILYLCNTTPAHPRI